jgi:hypothetical protein
MTSERAQTLPQQLPSLQPGDRPECSVALRRLQQHRRGPGLSKRAVVAHQKEATYAPSTCQQTHTALGPGLSQAHTLTMGRTLQGGKDACAAGAAVHRHDQLPPCVHISKGTVHVDTAALRLLPAQMHILRRASLTLLAAQHTQPKMCLRVLTPTRTAPSAPTDRCCDETAADHTHTAGVHVCTSLHARMHSSQHTPHKLHLYPPLMLLLSDKTCRCIRDS